MIIGIITIFILTSMLVSLNFKMYSIITGTILKVDCDSNTINVKYIYDNNDIEKTINIEPDSCSLYTENSDIILRVYSDNVKIDTDNHDDIIRSILVILILSSIIITFYL